MMRDANSPDSFRRKDTKPRGTEETRMIVSGIAHTFNNLFAVILGNSELMQNKLSKEAAYQKNLQEIRKAVFRGSDIINQLLYYAGLSDRYYEAIHLGPIVRDAVETLRVSGVPAIENKICCDEDDDLIVGNPSEIHRVLTGICSNALEAMEGKEGELRIELTNDDWKKHVIVVISDTGRGMNRRTQKKVFDPFFTTRPGIRGGMGLAVAQAIVARHSGTITVQSEIDKGTSFMVVFPRAEVSEGLQSGRPEAELGANVPTRVRPDHSGSTLVST